MQIYCDNEENRKTKATGEILMCERKGQVVNDRKQIRNVLGNHWHTIEEVKTGSSNGYRLGQYVHQKKS